MMSGRLVAPRTTIPLSSSIPSSSVRNWLMTRSTTWDADSEPRSGTRLSISSKNIIHGDACLAFLKISRIPFSLSPTHLERSSGPLTDMKLTSDSEATALASNVFPVPGGPKRNIPLGGLVFAYANNSLYLSGHSMVSFSTFLTSFSPPTSSHFTSGTSVKTSLMAEGSISFRASMKSSEVT